MNNNLIEKEAEKENESKEENNSKEANINEESNEIKENKKFSLIIEDFSKNLTALNELLNTEEFKQLTNFSANLNSNKKKVNKDPLTLNLNEYDNLNINAIKQTKNLKHKIAKSTKSIFKLLYWFSLK